MLAALADRAGPGSGACASLYRNPLKTDIAFIGRFASKSALARCTIRSRLLHSNGGGYARSNLSSGSRTDEQTTDNQERELRAAAERIGTRDRRRVPGCGHLGLEGRDQRPGFDAMHKDAARRRFDVVMAWSVDRLGRSLQDLCGFLSELHSLGIDLFLHQQGIDTTTPAGKAMFQMMGVFAEFERSMIRERVNAGIARAKADGKHCGRPFIDTKLEGRIRDALAAPGRPGLHKIAKQFGVGSGTVQRIAHAN